MRRLPWPIAALLLGVVTPSSALAQGSTRSLDLDPSVRATGMGGASSAVFWDGVNQWSNPGLLGYVHGLRYERGETQLVPDLAMDVSFTTDILHLGGGGFGLALSGKPGVGGLRVDYGTSTGTDEQGNPVTFQGYEDIESWGFGASLGRLVEAVAGQFGHRPPMLSRYGDVSLGMYTKEVAINLGTFGTAATSAHDRGLLLRLSPLEWLPATRQSLVGIDLAWGWSQLSYDGETSGFLGSTPPYQHDRRGFAFRAGLAWPEALQGWFGRDQWLREGLSPLLQVGAAFDHDDLGPGGAGYETDGHGYEIGLANLVSARFGSYQDVDGGIDDSTDGWSVGLPIGRLGGVRYDQAHFPEAVGLSKVKREGFSLWLDPLEIWSFYRHGASSPEQ